MTYHRTEHDGQGLLISEVDRSQTFTVEATSVEVTVPAGTFDCIQILRERDDMTKIKRFWFAAGVGKIKEENTLTGKVEELEVYSVP